MNKSNTENSFDAEQHLSEAEVKACFLNEGRQRKPHESLSDHLREHFAVCRSCRERVDFIEDFYSRQTTQYSRRRTIRNAIGAAGMMILAAGFLGGNLLTPSESGNITQEESVMDPLQSIDSLPDEKFVKEDPLPEDVIVEEKSSDRLPVKKRLRAQPIYTLHDAVETYRKAIASDKAVLLASIANDMSISLPDEFLADSQQERRLLASRLRSGSTLSIESPQPYSVHFTSVLFKWQDVSGKIQIVLKNNQNRKVWESEDLSGVTSTLVQKSLPPGRYYWDLRVDGKMRYKSVLFIVEPLAQ